MSHTPGPWTETDRSSSYINISGNPINAVGVPTGVEGEIAFEKVCRVIRHSPGEANARLIAAAPELLAACRELIDAMVDYGMTVDDPPTPEHRKLMLRAKAAVEKAVQS